MEDYQDAASRHFQDAKTLHKQVPSRLANASHLYGIAAECALKCIMQRGGNVPKGNSGHFPKLLAEFENHSVAKGNAGLVKQVRKHAQGLDNWRVEQRYYSQGKFKVEAVNLEAESARKMQALNSHHARGIV